MQTVQKTKINETLKKGDEYMQKHMPKEALNEYLKTLFSEKRNPKSYLGVSRAYKELKEYDKAIKHLEKAKNIASFDYEIYYELGLNHLLNTDFEKATKNFRKTIKLNPDFLNAQVQLAISHELMDEPEMAYKIYEKIIEEKPDFIIAHNHKAGLLMSMGDFEEAARIFFDILRIDDEYFRAYLGLGICFDKMEKYSYAVRFYKKYIEKNPEGEAVKSIASRIIDICSVTKDRTNCNLRIAK
ncbi:TPA: tetratricopeptide repeat protein [Candidatus Galligastranaerophilus gallistercoris]|nr:tetratricopeptide repeat protein [Candidatus Galligastranaerophilus gallistercoris]